ncbi:hypothetical protein [Streptomyces sp. NPDC058305]
MKSCQVILHPGREHGVERPITAVIDGAATVKGAATALLSRSLKPELYNG